MSLVNRIPGNITPDRRQVAHIATASIVAAVSGLAINAGIQGNNSVLDGHPNTGTPQGTERLERQFSQARDVGGACITAMTMGSLFNKVDLNNVKFDPTSGDMMLASEVPGVTSLPFQYLPKTDSFELDPSAASSLSVESCLR